jgi:putative nucleotidyltransferase with HDIG domain
MENRTQTILFVDDEENILDISKEYFQQKNYNVVTARNGVEAMEALEKEKIDCCFTDINMPEMDGLELAENIRQKDNTIPVIIMTGYPSLENTIKTLKNGVVDFLIKPVNLNQMELCVRRVLRERRLFVENIILTKEIESKIRIEKLNKELIYKVEELNCLNRIMNDVGMISTSTDVYKHIVNMTVELTKADESRFYIINGTDDMIFEVAYSTNGKEGLRSEKISEGLAGRLDCSAVDDCDDSKNEVKKLIMEVASDEIPLLVSENRGSARHPKEMLSLMLVPMKIHEKVFGVLSAFVKQGDIRFTRKDLYYISFMTDRAASAIENLALYEHINSGLITTLRAFVKAIEARDPYTKQHSNRVTEIAVIMGEEMGCNEEEIDILNIAGPLHDIGKIGIRDDILLKPGRLTSEEFEIIKDHPIIGASIVGQMGMWEEHQLIIRHHHERFDGTGYPDNLQEDEIPYLSRIMSVADAYDAMNSDRAYRKKMEVDKILGIIKQGSGSQFDPQSVSVFIKLHKEGKIT